jgi:hypothetical protein
MSDAPAAGGLTTDAVPAGATTSVTPDQGAGSLPASGSPALGAPATPGADVFGDLPTDQAVFPRSYVESLRTEGARYRTNVNEIQAKYQPYEDVFSAYDQADRDVWLGLAQTWAQDDRRAAEVMRQIANSVLGEAGTGDGSAGAAGPGDQLDAAIEAAGTASLSPDDVERLIEQRFTAREAQQQEAQLINDIYAEVRAGGYDPESAEGFMVLWNANHFTGGDVAKALEMTNTYKQQIIDNYVQGRTTGSVPMPSGAGSPATPLGEPITDLEGARRATDAYLRERRSAS